MHFAVICLHGKRIIMFYHLNTLVCLDCRTSTIQEAILNNAEKIRTLMLSEPDFYISDEVIQFALSHTSLITSNDIVLYFTKVQNRVTQLIETLTS